MIEASHLCRDFGDFRAVDDVSFSIQTGEIVGLLGPNGAGKTTTMRMVTGFLTPSSGTVCVDGLDITADGCAAKNKIGYMPESAPLYGDMITEDYLAYVARMYGKDPEERLPRFARLCGIGAVMDKNISDLSRGYRQRVGLAHNTDGYPFYAYFERSGNALRPRHHYCRRENQGGQSDRRTAQPFRPQRYAASFCSRLPARRTVRIARADGRRAFGCAGNACGKFPGRRRCCNRCDPCRRGQGSPPGNFPQAGSQKLAGF